MKMLLAAGIGFASLALAAPSQAAIVVFTGSRSNVDAPGTPAARCGGRATANIRNMPPTATSVGTSNLGAFTPTLSHCFTLPLSTLATNIFDLGEFNFDFGGGNVLLGTYSGTLNFIGAGQFAVAQTHIVTGGLGKFLGASGTFDSSGVLTLVGGPPRVTQQFSGQLNLPAVPEPRAWLLLILGFGAVGARLRTRTRASVHARHALIG